MTVTVRPEVHRGYNVFRPLCDNAHLFAGLAGKVFLPPDAIVVIMRLGYAVVYKEEQS